MQAVTIDLMNMLLTHPSQARDVFTGGIFGLKTTDGVYSYRIPALLRTTRGTLIAGADERRTTNNDYGDIDSVIRRSTDQGQTWSDKVYLFDLATNTQKDSTANSAFTIDMSLMQDTQTERIYAMVDMFPAIDGVQGLVHINKEHLMKNKTYLNEEPYSTVAGERRLNLYNQQGQLAYTVNASGQVYDIHNQPTHYAVKLTDLEQPFNELGDLYRDGTRLGNIFFVTDQVDDLHVARTFYNWVSFSDDDGETWSVPQDISYQYRQDWMTFLGFSPGNGITLQGAKHAGRLVVPVYTTNKATTVEGSQSARVLYSDDHGQTWTLAQAVNDGRIKADGEAIQAATLNDPDYQNSESAVIETQQGDLLLFMRNKSSYLQMARSQDGGASWGEVEPLFDIPSSETQIAATTLQIEGQEYVVLASAQSKERQIGVLYVGELTAGGSIHWVVSEPFQQGEYAYNSLQRLNEETIGLLYEHANWADNLYNLFYKQINIKQLLENKLRKDAGDVVK